MSEFEILVGDCREKLAEIASESIQTCVTSPPYFGLRDYGHEDQIGAESSLDLYVSELVAVFREVRRILKDSGTLWLNLGDSYASAPKGSLNGQDKSSLTSTQTQRNSVVGGVDKSKMGIRPKNLLLIPARVALALQTDGWYLRSDIIWHKSNPMPESVTDRPTKSHEHLFLLAKSERYYYDAQAISRDRSESLASRMAR